MVVLKFGGISLSNGKGLDNTLRLIKEYSCKEKIIVVVSARGDTTNQLLSFLDLAIKGEFKAGMLIGFQRYQKNQCNGIHFGEEFSIIKKILTKVSRTLRYSPHDKDILLAQGELLSSKLIHFKLNGNAVNSFWGDSGKFIITDSNFGNARYIDKLSRPKIEEFFAKNKLNEVIILPGFIGSDILGNTTTLGRNGSNLTASLICKYLKPRALHNYSHVEGVFSANPTFVENTILIPNLSHEQADELVSFGMNLLHEKSIEPLMDSKIPLTFFNTFFPNRKGTIISTLVLNKKNIALSLKEEVKLISIHCNHSFRKDLFERKFKILEKNNFRVIIEKNKYAEISKFYLVINDLTTKISTTIKKIIPVTSNKVSVKVFKISLIIIIGNYKDYLNSIKSTLNKKNIRIVLEGCTLKNNLIIGVEIEKAKQAIQILHDELINNTHKYGVENYQYSSEK